MVISYALNFIILPKGIIISMAKNIAIIGAGISGMSTAYVLINEGYSITIYANEFSPGITSNKAAAFWFPYHIRNDKRGIKWCNTSYNYYHAFAKNQETGISIHQLIKVLRKGVEEEEPIWKDFMPDGSYRVITEKGLYQGMDKVYDIEVPLIETQIFLPWLKKQLEDKGAKFIRKGISNFEELKDDHDLIVNCSALGARKLCGDHSVVPVRGQVGLLAPGPSLPIYLDNEKPLYIVPRKDAIIVGGTYEVSEEAEITEPATIEQIFRNAYEVFPLLASQKVIGSWAGLRPYRPNVRVEKETGKNLIHNYGHGGSGFTIAFGCAESVLEIIS